MKVFVAHLTSECNEHVSHDAELGDFLLLYGDECIDAMNVRDIFEDAGMGIVPSIFASLHPSGVISRDAFEFIADRILGDLKAHLDEIDAIYLQFHGASAVRDLECVSAEHYLTGRIREIVGIHMPIAMVMDPHGNVTSTLVNRSNIVRCYRESPHIDTVETSQANIQSLSEMMVGAKVDLDIDRPEPHDMKKRLEIKGLTCKDKEGVKTLDDVDVTVNSGEILGIAGISGSGQKELLEAVAGLQVSESGEILFYDDDGSRKDLAKMDSVSIQELGVSLAFVPEDRIGMGLVGAMDMTDNMMLRSYHDGKGGLLDRRGPRKLATEIKDQLEIMTPSISAPVRQMSGGNVQKVLVGREIAQNPKVLMVAYPTRGIDINSSHTIYRLLNEQKKNGVAVVCVIEDLDVLLALCDRIAVLCGGRVSGIVDARTATKEGIGLLMTKHEKGGEQ